MSEAPSHSVADFRIASSSLHSLTDQYTLLYFMSRRNLLGFKDMRLNGYYLGPVDKNGNNNFILLKSYHVKNVYLKAFFVYFQDYILHVLK